MTHCFSNILILLHCDHTLMTSLCCRAPRSKTIHSLFPFKVDYNGLENEFTIDVLYTGRPQERYHCAVWETEAPLTSRMDIKSHNTALPRKVTADIKFMCPSSAFRLTGWRRKQVGRREREMFVCTLMRMKRNDAQDAAERYRGGE